MFVVQISLLIVTFPSLISQNLSLMQTIKEVNPPSHRTVCQYVKCHLILILLFMPLVDCWSRPLKCCTSCYSIVSHAALIHVNSTKLRNITCTSVATGMILRSLECTSLLYPGASAVLQYCSSQTPILTAVYSSLVSPKVKGAKSNTPPSSTYTWGLRIG